MQDVWRLKNRLVIAEQPEQEAKSLAGSVVAFTKNGEFQGVAFRSAHAHHLSNRSTTALLVNLLSVLLRC